MLTIYLVKTKKGTNAPQGPATLLHPEAELCSLHYDRPETSTPNFNLDPSNEQSQRAFGFGSELAFGKGVVVFCVFSFVFFTKNFTPSLTLNPKP